MAARKTVYLRKLSSSKRQSVRLGKRLAGGGAGDIHRFQEVPGEVLKIYKTDKDRVLYAPKLEAMLANNPILLKINPKFPQLAWPTSIVESKNGRFLGFSMPEIDFDGSVSLERMLQKKMRRVTGLPEFYGYRLNAAHNLASCVVDLHKRGHHIIDLKPINCRLHTKEMLVSVLDCDGFSVNGGSAGQFPAHQFTPEYIAPEAFGRNPEKLGEAQDLFALAVIIFRLLNNGLHPFQCRVPQGQTSKTIQELINTRAYAYGMKKSRKYKPARQSIHSSFPDDIRDLFDEAFRTPSRPTAVQWRNALKDYADPSSGKLVRCNKNPDEHGHFGHGCGWCELDNINQISPKRGSTKSLKPATRRTTKTARKLKRRSRKIAKQAPTGLVYSGIPPSVHLTSIRTAHNRWSLILTIFAALVFLSYLV